MTPKPTTDADNELTAIFENALATRLVLLTLVTKTRRSETSLH